MFIVFHCYVAILAFPTAPYHATENDSTVKVVVSIILHLHDRASIEQTSSKCIQNARANCSTSARRLLDVC